MVYTQDGGGLWSPWLGGSSVVQCLVVGALIDFQKHQDSTFQNGQIGELSVQTSGAGEG